MKSPKGGSTNPEANYRSSVGSDGEFYHEEMASKLKKNSNLDLCLVNPLPSFKLKTNAKTPLASKRKSTLTALDPI